MQQSEAWPALRGTGVAPLRQQPLSPSLLFLFVSCHRMGSGRTVKFALCEVLQFAGLCVPLFIVMQRFAIIVAKVKTSAQPPGDGSTAYWLIVASSIAYVTSTALLVWVPLKYMVFMKKKFLIGRKKWWVSPAFGRVTGPQCQKWRFSTGCVWSAAQCCPARLRRNQLLWGWTGLWPVWTELGCLIIGVSNSCHWLWLPPLFFFSFHSFAFASGGLWLSFMWSYPHCPALPFLLPALRYSTLQIVSHSFICYNSSSLLWSWTLTCIVCVCNMNKPVILCSHVGWFCLYSKDVVGKLKNIYIFTVYFTLHWPWWQFVGERNHRNIETKVMSCENPFGSQERDCPVLWIRSYW